MNQVGVIDKSIANTLGIQNDAGKPIFIGQSNIAHMKNKHPGDFAKYGADIPAIIASPDYVGVSKKDGSIEYVKEYVHNGDSVKVAVRISNSGMYYARSLYVLNPRRVHNFITNGLLTKV